jgi:hypothetical protein
MQTTHIARNIAAALSIVLVAGALIGSTDWNSAKDAPAAPVAKATVPAPMVGVATGEFDHGAPVYRLPSVAVTTSRSVELARMAQEDKLAAK